MPIKKTDQSALGWIRKNVLSKQTIVAGSLVAGASNIAKANPSADADRIFFEGSTKTELVMSQAMNATDDAGTFKPYALMGATPIASVDAVGDITNPGQVMRHFRIVTRTLEMHGNNVGTHLYDNIPFYKSQVEERQDEGLKHLLKSGGNEHTVAMWQTLASMSRMSPAHYKTLVDVTSQTTDVCDAAALVSGALEWTHTREQTFEGMGDMLMAIYDAAGGVGQAKEIAGMLTNPKSWDNLGSYADDLGDFFKSKGKKPKKRGVRNNPGSDNRGRTSNDDSLRGKDARKVEQGEVNDAVKKHALSPDQREALHELLENHASEGGARATYQQVMDYAAKVAKGS